MESKIFKADFEKMYYELMGRIADIHEFLTYAEKSSPVIADTHTMLENIIETAETEYINYEENEKVCVMC